MKKYKTSHGGDVDKYKGVSPRRKGRGVTLGKEKILKYTILIFSSTIMLEITTMTIDIIVGAKGGQKNLIPTNWRPFIADINEEDGCDIKFKNPNPITKEEIREWYSKSIQPESGLLQKAREWKEKGERVASNN